MEPVWSEVQPEKPETEPVWTWPKGDESEGQNIAREEPEQPCNNRSKGTIFSASGSNVNEHSLQTAKGPQLDCVDNDLDNHALGVQSVDHIPANIVLRPTSCTMDADPEPLLNQFSDDPMPGAAALNAPAIQAVHLGAKRYRLDYIQVPTLAEVYGKKKVS